MGLPTWQHVHQGKTVRWKGRNRDLAIGSRRWPPRTLGGRRLWDHRRRSLAQGGTGGDPVGSPGLWVFPAQVSARGAFACCPRCASRVICSLRPQLQPPPVPPLLSSAASAPLFFSVFCQRLASPFPGHPTHVPRPEGSDSAPGGLLLSSVPSRAWSHWCVTIFASSAGLSMSAADCSPACAVPELELVR